VRKVLVPLSIFLAAAAAVYGVWASERIPDAPQPIAWDREACAHCHMHVGDPAFAAQAIAADGRVYDFDDPGCLLAWRARRAARGESAPVRVWFHKLDEDRWLPIDAVGFLPVPQSPMGSGLGAVERGRPGALGLDEATRRALAVEPSP